jgi:hypothetical protein
MPTDWTALLLAAGTGGLAATLISAFAKYWVFHPVISVRLDAKKGSYGRMMLYGASDEDLRTSSAACRVQAVLFCSTARRAASPRRPPGVAGAAAG